MWRSRPSWCWDAAPPAPCRWRMGDSPGGTPACGSRPARCWWRISAAATGRWSTGLRSRPRRACSPAIACRSERRSSSSSRPRRPGWPSWTPGSVSAMPIDEVVPREGMAAAIFQAAVGLQTATSEAMVLARAADEAKRGLKAEVSAALIGGADGWVSAAVRGRESVEVPRALMKAALEDREVAQAGLLACVPLVASGGLPFGVLYVEQRERPLDAEALSVLAALGRLAGESYAAQRMRGGAHAPGGAAGGECARVPAQRGAGPTGSDGERTGGLRRRDRDGSRPSRPLRALPERPGHGALRHRRLSGCAGHGGRAALRARECARGPAADPRPSCSPMEARCCWRGSRGCPSRLRSGWRG